MMNNVLLLLKSVDAQPCEETGLVKHWKKMGLYFWRDSRQRILSPQIHLYGNCTLEKWSPRISISRKKSSDVWSKKSGNVLALATLYPILKPPWYTFGAKITYIFCLWTTLDTLTFLAFITKTDGLNKMQNFHCFYDLPYTFIVIVSKFFIQYCWSHNIFKLLFGNPVNHTPNLWRLWTQECDR